VWPLLSDTKLRENIAQEVIRSDLSGNLTERIQGRADIQCQELARDLQLDSF
jgi:hypothetical protein